MSLGEHIVIGPYRPADRCDVRRISYETSFLGRPREFFENEEIVADLLTSYFTDREPESCFVVRARQKVVGYIIGTKDLRRMKSFLTFRMLPGLAVKAVARGVLFNGKNYLLLKNYCRSFLKREFKREDWNGEFPAGFHINIDQGYRGCGLGQKLLGRFFVYLKENRIPGVQAGTASEEAKDFFLANGFRLLFSTRRSYLKYREGEDRGFYLLGRRVT
jgi:ribosomal protein S18 acetylase RimI-like enzyme